jgi:hypothetical protein
MKIIFAIVVLIASVYLILPKDELKKLSAFLPQNQIEQAAEKVLSDVDQKLEQFKVKLSTNKDSRISQLEKKLVALKTHVIAQEEKYKTDIENKENVLQRLPEDQSLAKNQYTTSEPLSTHPEQQVANYTNLPINGTDKQRVIKRQAYLQDLVERMNKASLLTLTN